MLSRLAQGVNSVLQELSGEENPEAEAQDGVTLQTHAEDAVTTEDLGAEPDTVERLAHMEQLVVQLKEMIREKDRQLTSTERQLKEERETGEARFTKLKLQAKARMAVLSKEIAELKGQGGATAVQSPDISFTMPPGVEEELEQLRLRLEKEESDSRMLREQLEASEQLLHQKDEKHIEQLHMLQTVVVEKDLRFQEQVQRHEEELLKAAGQAHDDSELQQALHAAERRIEELEESQRSRTQVLEMLQQELVSADQQKQILTAQFRQMEQDLTDAQRLHEEESSKAQAELAEVRERLRAAEREREKGVAEMAIFTERQELAEKEKEELEKRLQAKMEAEALVEAELNSLRENRRQDMERRLQAESELAELQARLETAEAERNEATHREAEQELAVLHETLKTGREEDLEAQQKTEVLTEFWKGLHDLAEEKGDGQESLVPTDSSQCQSALQVVKTMLERLRAEKQQSEESYAQASLTVEELQGQLTESTVARMESDARIRHLEEQISSLQTSRNLGEPAAANPSFGDTNDEQNKEAEMPNVIEVEDEEKKRLDQTFLVALQKQLLEKEEELAALRSHLALAEERSRLEHTEESCESATSDQGTELIETSDAEQTLVAGDDSGLFPVADTESSTELISLQPESPEEREIKWASSDEMVTSTDSEVAQNSWTLLEAGNQEICNEWPSLRQERSHFPYQPWDEAIYDQMSASSLIQMESSSVDVCESVHIQISQQGYSGEGKELAVGLGFVGGCADELQKKHDELLAELQRLREDSQVRIKSLEEERQVLVAEKEKAKTNAIQCEEAMNTARMEFYEVSQRLSEMQTKDSQSKIMEEQLESLRTELISKDLSIQAHVDEAQRCFAEHESQTRMLSVQLEDREQMGSELEQKLREAEEKLHNMSLSASTAELMLNKSSSDLEGLQLQVTQKEQEVMELSEYMSGKLLQAEEEKLLISEEVTKLKEQVFELKQAWEAEHETRECSSQDSEELVQLRKDKEDLISQVDAMKKEGEQIKRKLQAALVQRKELLKKVGQFEKETERKQSQGTSADQNSTDISGAGVETESNQEVLKLEAALNEVKKTLKDKEEALEILEQKCAQKDHPLSEALVVNAEAALKSQTLDREEQREEAERLQSRITSIESECESLKKKLEDALDSRKETIRKAKEKDRRHREQLKQQKEEYNKLLERFEEQSSEKACLQVRLLEHEEKQKGCIVMEADTEKQPSLSLNMQAKPVGGDWMQEDWVDFSVPQTETQQPLIEGAVTVDGMEVKAQKDQVPVGHEALLELERQLKDNQEILSLREIQFRELEEELQLLREKQRQMDGFPLEIELLREKCQQAEAQAELLRAEVQASAAVASQGGSEGLDTPIANLQAEVEEFKDFLNSKNSEIMDLSQQLNEQNTLLQMMQETVSEKDHLIGSLQDQLKAEKEKNQQIEEQEQERTSDKLQQLQRKLQAALISRKEAMRESKVLKEEVVLTEKQKSELQACLVVCEADLEKIREEREKLINEVDRALLENQSLGASCESLKLAMEGVLKEKEDIQQQVAAVKDQAEQADSEWRMKIQGMKEEYEILLKSYENVSDEAERVRRVLEAARQERQELAAKVRAHETARQKAEQLAEESQKEVDSVKEKMRKFAKTKQQKIMDLEEEIEKLREKEEGKENFTENEGIKMKEQLKSILEEMDVLKTDLDTTRAERDIFEKEALELREQRFQRMDLRPEPPTLEEESLIAVKSNIVLAETCEKISQPKTIDANQDLLMAAPRRDVFENESIFQEKIIKMEADFKVERVSWCEREAALIDELASFEQKLHDGSKREANLKDEILKLEAKLKEIQIQLETERDDLEERLMNQLAQVNGSIAGYQQEVVDGRENLLELQHVVERLERERAELEVIAQSEKERAARLEEDKRQAQRERAEAEIEAGKHRELEQKLKSAQRGKEGSQSRARQLEELLREKQLEVRQMQKDCIQYQEKISEQEKEVKGLQLGKMEVKRELEVAHLETKKALGELKDVNTELIACRQHLNHALNDVEHIKMEKKASEETARQREAQNKSEAEQTLDDVRMHLGAKLKQLELRLEDTQREKKREERGADEARRVAEAREKQSQEVQARLDESLARLAAFSRSMSSLQDDRDRVLDEARQWESRFHSAIIGKEAEVQEAETLSRELGEQLQKEMEQRKELERAVERLQMDLEEWQQKFEHVEKLHNASHTALDKERGDLKEALTKVESSLVQRTNQLTSLEVEAEGHRRRAQALDEAVGGLQREVEEARVIVREREVEMRQVALSLEQLVTDLRSSKALTEALQAELGEKERREVELLGEKEQAVAQAAEDARREAEGHAREAEKELDEKRDAMRSLMERIQKAEEESHQSKGRLEAFTKAMGSLQDDRERVLIQYKQLEERHLQVMMEKDALIQEAAGENNGLKQEIRELLTQRDDLHSEKAKLTAELHSYRNDLNQVLSLKDTQHKQLLATQLQRIAAMEKEREEMQGRIQSLEQHREEEAGRVAKLELQTLSQASSREKLEGSLQELMEKMKEELEVSNEKVAALEESLKKEQEGRGSQSKELSQLRWEGGILRTQAETAEERVAELAQDVVELEQKLLVEREAATHLQAQNESFAKAMASLQDSREKALSEAQELRLHLEEINRTGAQIPTSSPPSSAGSTGEVWALKNALSALQNDRERLLEQLQIQRSELSRLSDQAGELTSVTHELEEEKRKTEERRTAEEQMLRSLREKEQELEREKHEVVTLRMEREQWQMQPEKLKEQKFATLSVGDQEIHQLGSMQKEMRTEQVSVTEEQHQRQALLPAILSSQPPVLDSDGVQLRSQLDDSLRELHMKEQKIIELSSKLSQVFEEKQQLSSQLRGSSQRLVEAHSRYSAVQRQLEELQQDKSKAVVELDSPPGAPQEWGGTVDSEGYKAEVKELQRRLEEELECRQVVEEQLSDAQDRLKRFTLGEWQSGPEGSLETAVFIEPPDGAVTRTRSSGPGLARMLRVAFCSRQRTPLLASLYLLTVHVLLLLCMGGYL